jgi:hypothetical protein
MGAIDLRVVNRKRRFPPNGSNAMTDDDNVADLIPDSSPSRSPARSPADSFLGDQQIVGTPNGSKWGLEPPSSSHSGSFMLEMFLPNANKGAEEPPTFVDHVRRSTRFVTSLPPTEVLSSIEEIVISGVIPLPPPFEHQETRMNWEDFRFEVRWDACLVYSVHVFVLVGPEGMNSNDYLVEFKRGHMEIFDFKRYYEAVLERLSRIIKDDPRVLDFQAAGGAGGLPGLSQDAQEHYMHEEEDMLQQGVFPFSD